MQEATFKDSKGHVWACRIDWAAMRRSASAGVDLSNVEEYLGDFFRGSHKLIDALWAVCSEQAGEMERGTFEARCTGDILEQAREALIAGLVDFFPTNRAKLTRAAADEIAGELAELGQTLESSSTGSPESSA